MNTNVSLSALASTITLLITFIPYLAQAQEERSELYVAAGASFPLVEFPSYKTGYDLSAGFGVPLSRSLSLTFSFSYDRLPNTHTYYENIPYPPYGTIRGRIRDVPAHNLYIWTVALKFPVSSTRPLSTYLGTGVGVVVSSVWATDPDRTQVFPALFLGLGLDMRTTTIFTPFVEATASFFMEGGGRGLALGLFLPVKAGVRIHL